MKIVILLISTYCMQALVNAQVNESGLAPCSTTDTECWAVKSNEYTNILRAENSVDPVSLGTFYMLENAVEYSVILDGKGSLEHQPISGTPGVFVGDGAECMVQLTGENLASFTASDTKRNYAWECVIVLWKNSPDHFKNIIDPKFKASMNGIYLGANDKVTCTQTFVSSTFDGLSGKCKNVGEETAEAAAPSPTPSPPTSKSPAPSSTPSAASTTTSTAAPTATPTASSTTTSTATPTATPTASSATTITATPTVTPTTASTATGTARPAVTPTPSGSAPASSCTNFEIMSAGIYTLQFKDNECVYCRSPTACTTAKYSVYLNGELAGPKTLPVTTNPACADYISRNLGSYSMRVYQGTCAYCNEVQCITNSREFDNFLNHIENSYGTN